MGCTLRDYIYYLSGSTLARLCGSTKYVVIDRKWGEVLENIKNRGISETYDWTMKQVEELFKEVA